jgi:hypothetical protein
MIGELLIGQLVGFDEASIAHHRVHPFFPSGGSGWRRNRNKAAHRRFARVSHDHRLQKGVSTAAGERSPAIPNVQVPRKLHSVTMTGTKSGPDTRPHATAP